MSDFKLIYGRERGKRNGGETRGEKRDGRKDRWLIDRLEKIKGQKIDRKGRKRG